MQRGTKLRQKENQEDSGPQAFIMEFLVSPLEVSVHQWLFLEPGYTHYRGSKVKALVMMVFPREIHSRGKTAISSHFPEKDF